jgi:uncharacterized membrane protein
MGETMERENASNEKRLLAALGYPIGIIAIVVLLTDMKQNRFMRYHAVHAIGLIAAALVVFLALSLVTTILFSISSLFFPLAFLTPLVMLGWLALTVWYAFRAYQGEMFTIPALSAYAARYLK